VVRKVSGYAAAETCWYLSSPDVQDNEHYIPLNAKKQEADKKTAKTGPKNRMDRRTNLKVSVCIKDNGSAS
jgi:hypothetical protein